MALANNYPLYRDRLYVFSPSIGTSPVSAHVVLPYRCKVTKLESVLGAPITAADCTVVTKIGSTTVTGGTITIANSSSASGDLDSATPTGSNTGNEGDILSFDPSGATGTATPGHFFAYIIPA